MVILFLVPVGVAAYRLRNETRALAWLILVRIALTLVVLGFFAIDTLRNSPETFAAIGTVAGLAIVPDLAWKRMRGEPPTGLAAPAVPATQE